MATRGRKPDLKPNAVPPGQCPEPPDWLDNNEALGLWREYAATINALGLLERLDSIAFATLCNAFATLQEMKRKFARDPDYTLVVGENGAVQQNPLCQMIAQQVKGVLQLLAEFGMTPVSRKRLTGSTSCEPAGARKNPMEALMEEAQASIPTQPVSAPPDKTKRRPKAKAKPKKK